MIIEFVNNLKNMNMKKKKKMRKIPRGAKERSRERRVGERVRVVLKFVLKGLKKKKKACWNIFRGKLVFCIV